MQQIFDKLIPVSGNEKLGKIKLYCDAGKSAFTGNSFPEKKKLEHEPNREKNNDEIVMFDIFGALSY